MKKNTEALSPLTLTQAIIITGYTGIACCPFEAFHEDVERRLERPVLTHEFSNKSLQKHIKKIYKKDFIAICPEA